MNLLITFMSLLILNYFTLPSNAGQNGKEPKKEMTQEECNSFFFKDNFIILGIKLV